MSHTQTLPIHEIKVENRQRLDLGDIDSLAQSLQAHGLIQPIVVSQDKRLIAGGRRLAAAQSIGWKDIPVVYRETMSEDELYILELEENVQRLEMSWQERALNILTVHELKVKINALDCKTWGQKETGAMMGMSKSHINYCLIIAYKLRSELNADREPLPNARYWACDSLASAWALRIRDQEDDALAELAKRHQQNATSDLPVDDFFTENSPTPIAEETIDLAYEEAKRRYESNPLNTIPFDEYRKQKEQAQNERQLTIPLSKRLFNVDCIKFMSDPDNAGRFHHVITDIPYAIDMDNLNQQNIHGGFANLDTVEELHDVDYNLKLIADFFPAAFKATREKGFVITWCDQMLWQYMYDHAIKAGFAVQRWPITWVKTSSCMNQCVNFNTTKDTEIAIVCRKKGTTLVNQPQTSVVTAPRDEMCKTLNHPFAKPFAIWEFLIKTFTLENEVILEPFAGRGSGVLSLLKTNRNYVACELDTTHFNALQENIRTYYRSLNPDFIFR